MQILSLFNKTHPIKNEDKKQKKNCEHFVKHDVRGARESKILVTPVDQKQAKDDLYFSIYYSFPIFFTYNFVLSCEYGMKITQQVACSELELSSNIYLFLSICMPSQLILFAICEMCL